MSKLPTEPGGQRAAVPTRPWRGIDASARTAQRRARLLEAGLESFATDGYAGTTVADICRSAQLTQRYFYESFTDREALLMAVLEEIGGLLLARVATVLNPAGGPLTTARATIAEAVSVLLEDPRRAQVMCVESVGISATVETRRRELLAILGGIVREVGLATLAAEGAPLPSREDADLTARALVGGAIELMVGYVRGELTIDRERVVEHLARLFAVAAPLTSSNQDNESQQEQP